MILYALSYRAENLCTKHRDGKGGEGEKERKSSLSVEVLLLNKEAWFLAETLGARRYPVNSPLSHRGGQQTK